MTKRQAEKWYVYYFKGMDNFNAYYSEWKNWFDSRKYDPITDSDKMKNITATEIDNMYKTHPCSPVYELGNCTATTPSPGWTNQYYIDDPDFAMVPKQEGNNPMLTNKSYAIPQATSAYASSITIMADEKPSDAMTQRDYLLSELREMTRREWDDTSKVQQLKKLFNLDAPVIPRTSQEILDAFSKNLITVDQAKVDAQTKFLALDEDEQDDAWREGIRDRYYGITFTALPVADLKGYQAAYADYQKLVKNTERTIKIASPADGLAALMAFDAWMPTQTAPTTTTVQ